MTTLHTPGPWSIWNFSDDPRHIAVGPNAGGLAVADVVACNAHGCYTAETESRGQANARLIAAAPAMLAALQSVARLLDDPDADHFDADKVQAEVEAAIKLATGVQP